MRLKTRQAIKGSFKPKWANSELRRLCPVSVSSPFLPFLLWPPPPPRKAKGRRLEEEEEEEEGKRGGHYE